MSTVSKLSSRVRADSHHRTKSPLTKPTRTTSARNNEQRRWKRNRRQSWDRESSEGREWKTTIGLFFSVHMTNRKRRQARDRKKLGGRKSSAGSTVLAGGEIYTGGLCNGQPHGVGKTQDAEGRMLFEGMFHRGMRVSGILSQDGIGYSQTYVNGEFGFPCFPPCAAANTSPRLRSLGR